MTDGMTALVTAQLVAQRDSKPPDWIPRLGNRYVPLNWMLKGSDMRAEELHVRRYAHAPTAMPSA